MVTNLALGALGVHRGVRRFLPDEDTESVGRLDKVGVGGLDVLSEHVEPEPFREPNLALEQTILEWTIHNKLAAAQPTIRIKHEFIDPTSVSNRLLPTTQREAGVREVAGRLADNWALPERRSNRLSPVRVDRVIAWESDD
ncbi:hypothetical protein [Haladaptatus litoreus]|uniref:hypothetical protein n=1 Tax=Haladaptatus litoreus TaxID=553468 RepID=UPI001115635E|nr:hypothetical protein [Haladaptatus litoreus]